MPASAPGQGCRAQFFCLEGNFVCGREQIFEELPCMLSPDFHASVVEQLLRPHGPEARCECCFHLPAAVLGAWLGIQVFRNRVHALYGICNDSFLVGFLLCREVDAISHPHH
jgi:hypothetical protein